MGPGDKNQDCEGQMWSGPKAVIMMTAVNVNFVKLLKLRCAN